MNREAVAVAADSAVSLMGGPSERPQKIFTSANKIFSLSRFHTVCIMIYNNATFMGMPWETIVDAYKKHLGKKTFGTLREYGEDLIAFLSSAEELIPRPVEEKYFISAVRNYFLFIRYLIQQRSASFLQEKGAITENDIQTIITEVIVDVHTTLDSASYSPTLDAGYYNELLDYYGEEILKASREIYADLPVPEDLFGRLEEIAVNFFVKNLEKFDPLHQEYTGVVVIGFGEKEILPGVMIYDIEGKIRGRLKYAEGEHQQITFEHGAMIIPFAQREMVDIFLTGMDPRFEQALITTLSATFHNLPVSIIDSIDKLDATEKAELKEKFSKPSEDLVDQLEALLTNYRGSNFTPIINVVMALPKSDLAALVESLVNLTSLKRRVSMD
ncbi:MAG: hypothetical protein LUO93_09595, partial [Methanomicrobiales archaeon]|nr:hypothetical protein [Methanomicrobiales archaeon]